MFRVDDPADYDYIIDVGHKYDGRKFFDHHQEITVYPDGVMPCGVSLFAEHLSKEMFVKLYERVMRPICVQDNGQEELMVQYPNLLFGWVHQMNQLWCADDTPDEKFKEAVEMAIPILLHAIMAIKADEMAEDIYNHAKTVFDGKIVVLPRYVPWHEFATAEWSNAVFVIHPSNRGGYMVQCVPPDAEHGFQQRLPLPESWLAEKPDGCTFVHKALFCASFDTQESAIAALSTLL